MALPGRRGLGTQSGGRKRLEKLEGIIPALLTPYDADGEVKVEGLEKFLSFFIDRGCAGFFVGGSTGEGPLQTPAERCCFIEAVVKTVAGQVPVVAHVGALSTRDACEIARFAAEAGADAVGSVMPIYYRVGTRGAVEYYRAIGEAAGLPLLIYYLAGATAGTVDAEIFAENFAKLPHVFALKYTSPDLEMFRQIIELTGGKLNMIMGCDQLVLPALTLGADAAIGTSYNFMPEIYVALYKHYRRGAIKEAQELMIRAFRIIHLLKRKYPILEACREIARMRGLETGHCRGPIPDMTPEMRQELRADLEALDFFSDPIR